MTIRWKKPASDYMNTKGPYAKASSISALARRFRCTDSTDLFVGYTRTVAGRNTHAVNRGLSLGVAEASAGSTATPRWRRRATAGPVRSYGVCEKKTGP
jgi:hypothetical protein